MNRRVAKREACWRAAIALRSAMDSGWPYEQYESDEDLAAVSGGLEELIVELERRGHT